MNLPEVYRLLLSLLFVAVVSYDVTARDVTARQIEQRSGLAAGQPGMNIYPSIPPGEAAPLERPYPGAPPMVPHDVTDLEIVRSSNDCLVCHLEGTELSEGHAATRIPASHYTNDFTGELKKDTVAGIRYNCLQCHVPQVAE